MKRRWIVSLGLLAFVWTLVMHAPARLLYGWFAPKTSTLQLVGLQGNLSEGHVAGISNGGNVVLRGLHWRFHPLWLLLLRASFEIEANEPADVSGNISLMPWGVNLSGVKVLGSLKLMLGAVNVAYLPIDGNASADLLSLHLRSNAVTSAEGQFSIHGLVWSLAKPPSQLGDFEANITTENDSIVARIESPTGPLEAHGDAHLNADGSYSWDIQIKAKPEADQNTRNLLHSMGQPDAQGFYHAKNAGQLPSPKRQ